MTSLSASPSRRRPPAELPCCAAGLGLVTGDIGAGKSTATRAFIASSRPGNRYFVISSANPTVGITGLYRDIPAALHHQPLSAVRVRSRLSALPWLTYPQANSASSPGH
ncbi:MAG: hypothetical protein IPK53_11395 [bacterium]|nr:hypothetical protein [bacterium]